jgi:hypothetical protein
MKHALLIVLALCAGCAGPGGIAPLQEFRLKTTDGRDLTLRCPVVDREAAKGLYVVQDYCIAIGETPAR